MWGFSRRKKNPEIRDVTKKEFVDLAVKAGYTEEEASRLAEQSQGRLFDGHVKVGDELLQVVAFKPSSSTT